MYHYFLASTESQSAHPTALLKEMHSACNDLVAVFDWLVEQAIDHHFTMGRTMETPSGQSISRLYLVLPHDRDVVALRLRWGGALPKTLDDPTFLSTEMWLV